MIFKNKKGKTQEEAEEIINSKLNEKMNEIVQNYNCEICNNDDFFLHTYRLPYFKGEDEKGIKVESMRQGENVIKFHCSKCGNLKYFHPSVILKDIEDGE